VVGFDDIPAATLFWPGLTTVRQQMRSMGAAACRTLLTALLEEQPERSSLEFPMDLIVRQSTGAAPSKTTP
jgi:LacI family transcriptional regulator